jgi:hypothetical protein
MSIFSIVLLIIFGVSIVAAYMYVRRTSLSVTTAGIYGSIVNVIVLTLFSLSMGSDLIRALLTGAIMGILFNVLAVVAAGYFRKNEIAHKPS